MTAAAVLLLSFMGFPGDRDQAVEVAGKTAGTPPSVATASDNRAGLTTTLWSAGALSRRRLSAVSLRT
jgi:hypothetical protein